MRKIYSLIAIAFFGVVNAQELNCTVTVNADQVAGNNMQVYSTLQRSLTDFVNKTDWTGQGFKNNERINCSMFINITVASGSTFTATIQVASSRPAFNSTYFSPVFNFNDKEFVFDYTEFQNLTFNPTLFDSNLISVVAYYCFMIIGIDGDTFSLEGGRSALETAQEIVGISLSSGYKGWSGSDGNSNRFFLVNDMLSPTFISYREAMFQYHYEGIDVMNRDMKSAKEKIKSAVAKLSELHSVRPNAFITRVFFDAKSDEIVSIFSGGPKISITDMVDNLNRVSPLNASKWVEVRF